MHDLEFEQVVSAYYEPLYRFALSLSRSEADASDLTQQTFYIWASKGGQLRDAAKVKTWLFTTLHREFLGTVRRQGRFAHHELSSVESELPAIEPDAVSRMESAEIMAALMSVEEPYLAPLALFYLGGHSYHEIAKILNVPPGTAMSRLARGKDRLRARLSLQMQETEGKIVPLPRQHAG
ncbi:MAG: RNA polymerase sigma factor [Verrucomicrobia bacterium]|nr:RNA polymerase sigma factor [Verrucomicrobiota bacterium]